MFSRVAKCSCGSVQITVKGDPELVAACSCGECQRQTGSVLNVSAYWLSENAEVTGATSVYTRVAQSGGAVTLHFCPDCGSSIFWLLNDLKPDWICIGVGMFSDPDFPPPTVSVWENRKHSWVSTPAASCFDEQPF